MSVSAISARARGRLAEQLVPVAVSFAGVVRSEDAEGVGAFLSALTPSEREVLPVVLAAMVDVDRTPQELLSWVTWDELERPLPPGAEMVLYSPRYNRTAPVQPCGTWAAAQRHRKNGEALCDPCGEAAKAHDAVQNQRRKEAKEASAA